MLECKRLHNRATAAEEHKNVWSLPVGVGSRDELLVVPLTMAVRTECGWPTQRFCSSSPGRRSPCTWCRSAPHCWRNLTPEPAERGSLSPEKQQKKRTLYPIMCLKWFCLKPSPPHKAVLHSHLEYVVSWRHIRDVDPLAVNVGVIRVIAARTEPLGNVFHYFQIMSTALKNTIVGHHLILFTRWKHAWILLWINKIKCGWVEN